MHTFLDAKAMAKTLRGALAEHGVAIPHALSLELVARQFGLDDWNTLAARIETSAPARLPRGWRAFHSAAYPVHRLGSDPNDPSVFVLVGSSSPDVIAQNFATPMRSIDAAPYRCRSIRLSAELRGEDVDAGTIWLRIDGDRDGPDADRRDAHGNPHTLRFDNLLSRDAGGALSGNFNWTRRTIAFDVPPQAHSIHYGPMLRGSGQLWARGLRLEAVA